VPNYLVETYLPRGGAAERASRERRARSAARDLTRRGSTVGFERSIHVPEDETCFFVFEAPSRQVAALAAERAQLDPLRIVEAITSSDKEER